MKQTSQNDAPAKAGAREWAGLAVLALPCMLYSMDLTVLNLAVPQLAADLKPSASQMLWIIDIYGFMVAGFLMTMGAMGDRFGRRRLLLIGAAAFGAASALAAFAKTAEQLIALRALLGIAGATLAPSTLSLIAQMFRDEREQGFAISMWIASFSAGAVLGPLVGGFFIEKFWWGAVFLMGVPVMALLLAIGPLILPEGRAEKPAPVDLTSVLLSLVAVLLAVFGVKRLAEHGLAAFPLAAAMTGLALGFLFWRRQQRLADPLIDPALLRNARFTTALAMNLTGLFFMFGAFMLIAQYFQLVAGLSPIDAGLWSLPGAAVFGISSLVAPALAGRIQPGKLIALSMALTALGFALLAFANGLVSIVITSCIFSAAFTPVASLTTGIIVNSAPPERAGAASALSETSFELGGALGIAVLGSLAGAVFRGRTGVSLPPGADTAAASSLSAAIEAAKALPQETAEPFLALAREAFASGLRITAVFAALGTAAAAVAAWKFLAQNNRGANDARQA